MDNPKENNRHQWVKFTSLGLQMGITIYLGSLLGGWLDKAYPSTSISYFKTITMIAVFLSTVAVIREVIKMNN
jgi:hypothetical protein